MIRYMLIDRRKEGIALTIGDELSDEMLENVSGGASNKEIIKYINTNMSAVPESTRKMIIADLKTSGRAKAVKTAIFLLQDDQDSLQSLLDQM